MSKKDKYKNISRNLKILKEYIKINIIKFNVLNLSIYKLLSIYNNIKNTQMKLETKQQYKQDKVLVN